MRARSASSPSSIGSSDPAGGQRPRLTTTLAQQLQKNRKRWPLIIRATGHQVPGKARTPHRQALLAGPVLRSHPPSGYAKDVATMTASLRTDIEEKLAWKTHQFGNGLHASYRIAPRTAQNLHRILKQVCGFAELQMGMTGILSLNQVLVPEVLGPMIDWLVKMRGCTSRSVAGKMHSIHALLTQHPDFRSRDHSWLLRRIGELPREANWKASARRIARSLTRAQLSQVPTALEAVIASSQNPVEIAWLKHDLLLFRWTQHHPWRTRNLAECGLMPPAQVNLVLDQIPLDLRHSLELPAWAKQQLKQNPAAKFWQFVFREDETMGKRPVQDLVARDLLKLYDEYVKVHRPRLVAGGADPGTLFLNRRSKAMSEEDVLALYARLTERYLGRRATLQQNRDSFAVHHLQSGGSMVALRKALWHRDVDVTSLRWRGFNE